MNLNDKEWSEFVIGDLFDEIKNSKAYHKKDLKSSLKSKLPYITRTANNNGLDILIEDGEYIKNPKNTIVFGAESAMFFYQPCEYITGNKMYYINDEHFNKYVCLFLVTILNNNIGKKFGYSRGLTASRLKREKILLPVNENNEPDYEFMEEYIQQKYKTGEINVIDRINEKLEKLDFVEIEDLSEKEWSDFYIHDIFDNVQRGKRLIKANFMNGEMPYVSSTGEFNGLDNYIGNNEKVRIFNNCITLANSGSVGSTFYHPYSFIASDHVTHLKNEKFDKYTYLFLASVIKRIGEKYNFNREIIDTRLKREIIVLPITKEGVPDYSYMRQYMINQEINVLKKYLNYVQNQFYSDYISKKENLMK